jgi:hypothetical protein
MGFGLASQASHRAICAAYSCHAMGSVSISMNGSITPRHPAVCDGATLERVEHLCSGWDGD